MERRKMANRKMVNKKQRKEKVCCKEGDDSIIIEVANLLVMRSSDAGVSRASLVQGGLQVKSALKKASEGHDQQKKLSTTYQSIFSNPDEKKSGMHMTGVYLK